MIPDSERWWWYWHTPEDPRTEPQPVKVMADDDGNFWFQLFEYNACYYVKDTPGASLHTAPGTWHGVVVPHK